MKLLKLIRRVCIPLMLVCALLAPGALPAEAASGVNVDVHTQDDIRNYYYALNQKRMKAKAVYTVRPVIKKGSYVPGVLSDDTLAGALDEVNYARYIAGIPYNVALDSNYTVLAQDAALVDAAINQLTHYPEKPAGMADDLYLLGSEGCQNSNLSYAHQSGTGYQSTFADDIEGYLSDKDNVVGFDPGHRRWILNPVMQLTGFGKAGDYSALYALNNWQNTDTTTYTGVAWPAQNMPVELFSAGDAWSISFGRQLSETGIAVTLTRTSDGRVWNFDSSKADGKFLVSNENYGQTGCVIFRPNKIRSYQAGSSYSVLITENGQTIADYTVSFFRATVTMHIISYPKKGKVKLTWTNPGLTGNEGYAVFRTSGRYAKFGSKPLAVITDPETLTYTDKTAKRGKHYYYKVTPYRMIDGKAVYGEVTDYAAGRAK